MNRNLKKPDHTKKGSTISSYLTRDLPGQLWKTECYELCSFLWLLRTLKIHLIWQASSHEHWKVWYQGSNCLDFCDRKSEGSPSWRNSWAKHWGINTKTQLLPSGHWMTAIQRYNHGQQTWGYRICVCFTCRQGGGGIWRLHGKKWHFDLYWKTMKIS